MSKFTWEGTNSTGKTVKGAMEAKDSQAVYAALKAQQITPNVSKIKDKSSGLSREIKIPGMGAKVKSKDIVIFTRQFATMIDAGLPLVKGIEVLGSSNPNPAMKKILMAIKDDVQNGGTLSDAFARHPKTFNTLFVHMVEAGEVGGILDTIMNRMAIYLEKMDKLRRQIKTAMIYPSVVVAVAIIVTCVLLVFVVPTFADVFSSFGAELPLPTQIVINMSTYMTSYGHIIFTIGIIFFILFRKFTKTDRGKDTIHPILLKLPVIGELVRKVAVASFCRTMGTMLSSGVPILDTLSICAKTAGNKVVERELIKVRGSISEGKSLSEPLANSAIFPPMVVQMISVGESTGALDAMLSKVADFYDDEVENSVGALKQLIEPLMIVVLGVLIGGLVVAMYLPIFKMGDAIG